VVAAKPRCKPVTCMWLQQTCAHKSVLKACPAAHLHAKSVECMWLHAIPWICFHGSHYAETNESKTTNKSIALSLRQTVSKAQLWILMAEDFIEVGLESFHQVLDVVKLGAIAWDENAKGLQNPTLEPSLKAMCL